jgi:hypothetical protein
MRSENDTGLKQNLKKNMHIENVLSINNHNFHIYAYSVYLDELEIKDTTESDKSASHL